MAKMGPPTKYRPEYCGMLVDHMEQGKSFLSFAATLNVCFRTLYEWTEAHEEFSQAKANGEAKALAYWEEVGQTMSLGQLRRVKTEVYQRDDDGNIMFQDGKPIVASRTFAHVKGDPKVWQTTMRARFSEQYRAELAIHKVRSKATDPASMTDAELDAAIREAEKRDL